MPRFTHYLDSGSDICLANPIIMFWKQTLILESVLYWYLMRIL